VCGSSSEPERGTVQGQPDVCPAKIGGGRSLRQFPEDPLQALAGAFVARHQREEFLFQPDQDAAKETCRLLRQAQKPPHPAPGGGRILIPRRPFQGDPVLYHRRHGRLDDGHGVAPVGSQKVGQDGVGFATAGAAVPDDGDDHDQDRVGYFQFPQVLGMQHHFCPADRAVPLYPGEIEPEMNKIIIYGITQMSYNQGSCWVEEAFRQG